MIYKCLEHGLKGQNILAQGNVLGKSISMKIVREIQFENAENVIRTELFLLIFKKRDFSNFVRNYCKTLSHEMRGRFKPFELTPGDARGYYNFPLSGKLLHLKLFIKSK